MIRLDFPNLFTTDFMEGNNSWPHGSLTDAHNGLSCVQQHSHYDSHKAIVSASWGKIQRLRTKDRTTAAVLRVFETCLVIICFKFSRCKSPTPWSVTLLSGERSVRIFLIIALHICTSVSKNRLPVSISTHGPGMFGLAHGFARKNGKHVSRDEAVYMHLMLIVLARLPISHPRLASQQRINCETFSTWRVFACENIGYYSSRNRK